MKVIYANKQIEEICTNGKIARKKYGINMANKIATRIKQLISADSVEMMVQLHWGRCHKLLNNREGQYAMDLEHPYRLIFTIKNDELLIAKIIEIVDYH
ncbi:MAG: type II toxin-antitoxin system RelE/ParE family toxin [Acholeplasmatales bacterium]|nr:type II toxin-antitoxin system RelE/ParE family toxin [Acholeplasmatales bacterium]